jgi:hypothetical protein
MLHRVGGRATHSSVAVIGSAESSSFAQRDLRRQMEDGNLAVHHLAHFPSERVSGERFVQE